MKKILSIILVVLILALIGGGLYWYFYMRTSEVVIDENGNTVSTSRFSPFTRTGTVTIPTTPDVNTQATTTDDATPVDTEYKLPKLRQLSLTPVTTMVASSTASSTLVRFIDRGTGHVYEASSISNDIEKISNTTLPKIYEGYANKNGNAFVLRYLKGDTDTITNFYAELRSTGTSTGESPYELKGKYLSPDVREVAVSPNGDRVFTWNIESGKGIGYISSFDEKTKTKVADTFLNQVTLDWPEANTVIVSTKPSGVSSSYIYTIDTRTGLMKNVMGGLGGLTGKMSHDLSELLYSSKSGSTFSTYILNTKDNSSREVIFRTLSDKCVWSKLRKNEVYCAVPTEIPSALYPDDWYKGSVSFVDQIWHLNTTTGEVHLLANLLNLSDKLIDATNLTVDPKEDMLYFINKRDLTLWALDLNQ